MTTLRRHNSGNGRSRRAGASRRASTTYTRAGRSRYLFADERRARLASAASTNLKSTALRRFVETTPEITRRGHAAHGEHSANNSGLFGAASLRLLQALAGLLDGQETIDPGRVSWSGHRLPDGPRARARSSRFRWSGWTSSPMISAKTGQKSANRSIGRRPASARLRASRPRRLIWRASDFPTASRWSRSETKPFSRLARNVSTRSTSIRHMTTTRWRDRSGKPSVC